MLVLREGPVGGITRRRSMFEGLERLLVAFNALAAVRFDFGALWTFV